MIPLAKTIATGKQATTIRIGVRVRNMSQATSGQSTRGGRTVNIDQLASVLGAGATLDDLKDYLWNQLIDIDRKQRMLQLDALRYTRLLKALAPGRRRGA